MMESPSSARRIAMLSWESLHSISVGGLARHVTELAEALAQQGHDVHIFTRMDAGQSLYDLIHGVHYHRCPFAPDVDFLRYIQRMCDAFVERLRAAEEFDGRPFDVIHGHDWLCAQALARVRREWDRPIVLTFHSTEFGRCGNEFREGQSRQIRDIEWLGADVADKIICVSKALSEEVQRIYSMPAAKTTVLYNGVDVHRFDIEVEPTAVRSSIGIGKEDPFVLFVGRLVWQKGPDLLLGAVRELLHQHKSARFVFAGDGDMRASLEAQAAELGLGSAVRFLGYRNGNGLVSLFKSCDVLCVPSRNEPFGIVVLEGWSATRPVVVTRSGGPTEFVRDQVTGLVVSIDRESLGEGVNMALGDRERANCMARSGRQDAEDRFSWKLIAAETAKVYDGAL